MVITYSLLVVYLWVHWVTFLHWVNFINNLELVMLCIFCFHHNWGHFLKHVFIVFVHFCSGRLIGRFVGRFIGRFIGSFVVVIHYWYGRRFNGISLCWYIVNGCVASRKSFDGIFYGRSGRWSVFVSSWP